MKKRWLAQLGIAAILLPGVVTATSVNQPLSWDRGGPFLAGFEVESMVDEIDGESVSGTRYLARLTWKTFENVAFSLRAGGGELDVESTVHGSSILFGGEPKFAVGAGGTWVYPVRKDRLSLFADAQLLYTLSYGNTSFKTTIQSSVFREEYENRVRWDEYQGAVGAQYRISWARFYSGAALRSVDGSVSRKTFQTGSLVSESSDTFSKEFEPFGLVGLDIPFARRMLFSVGAQAGSGDQYAWTISFSEFSR